MKPVKFLFDEPFYSIIEKDGVELFLAYVVNPEEFEIAELKDKAELAKPDREVPDLVRSSYQRYFISYFLIKIVTTDDNSTSFDINARIATENK